MATVPKVVYSTGDEAPSASGDINFQPAMGKVWWFRELRYTLDLRGDGVGVNATVLTWKHVIGSTELTLLEKSVTEPAKESGRDDTMPWWASNDNYLRFSYQVGPIGTSYARWVFAWLGVEIDV